MERESQCRPAWRLASEVGGGVWLPAQLGGGLSAARRRRYSDRAVQVVTQRADSQTEVIRTCEVRRRATI